MQIVVVNNQCFVVLDTVCSPPRNCSWQPVAICGFEYDLTISLLIGFLLVFVDVVCIFLRILCFELECLSV